MTNHVKLFLIAMLTVTAGDQHFGYRDFLKTLNRKGYGTEWIYFPDGDDNLHYVNLTMTSFPRPESRMKLDVEFKLYSEGLKTDFILLDEAAQSSDNNVNLQQVLRNGPVKIVTHGWMSAADKSAVMDITNAYRKTNKYINVIAVDWSQYSMNIFYTTVASQTKEVGIHIAKFLNALHDKYNVTGDRIHLIGHSLGAHVMGMAGYETKLQIGRITGLDPALPGFDDIQTDKNRLDSQDASFVDIIHTCGGILGFWDAIGTTDFYPNNGKAPQPGCVTLKNLIDLDACSHGRSHIYFAESIYNPKAFPAYLCNYWTKDLENMCPLAGYMGDAAGPHMAGIFYVLTNSEKPFGRGVVL